ncbi:MAG TPA: Fic family protein [Saprospiraceae bacterium]|nr:Fic family protein [Saprospiraceae bacterium]
MLYNWQQSDWPNFKYNLSEIRDLLLTFAEKAGRVSGILSALPSEVQAETIIDIMVSEAIKTSEIEGEFLSREDVVSSIRKNMGLITITEPIMDKRAEGIGKLMINVRSSFNDPISQESLFMWHSMLMEGNKGMNVGRWRSHLGPMQVISGAIGKEKVHFEAPPSLNIVTEMDQFIDWFNETGHGAKNEIKYAPVRSAIAHLYFESIHPFEDGNGRIGRAISEKALAQSIGRPVLLSLSSTIEKNKKEYYNALENAQRSNEITSWINYFIKTLLQAQFEAENLIEYSLRKVKFFDQYKYQLNDRQLKVINRMLEEGPNGFDGGMNAKKYADIANTSKATATRDLQDLLVKDAFLVIGGGRSTRYRVNI